jgi:hypothetical protein
MISVVALAIALYSASMLLRDTITYFRALQAIKLGPRNTAYPPVDRLSSGLLAQTASEKQIGLHKAPTADASHMKVSTENSVGYG